MIRFPYYFFFKFLIVLLVLFCVLNVSIDKGFTRLVTQNGIGHAYNFLFIWTAENFHWRARACWHVSGSV